MSEIKPDFAWCEKSDKKIKVKTDEQFKITLPWKCSRLRKIHTKLNLNMMSFNFLYWYFLWYKSMLKPEKIGKRAL